MKYLNVLNFNFIYDNGIVWGWLLFITVYEYKFQIQHIINV